MFEMAKVPKGKYLIGTNQLDGFVEDKEGPQVEVSIDAFEIGITTVTNQEFQKFVEETGYITESEKYGWSHVFHYFLSEDEILKAKKVSNLSSWYAVPEANWKHPEGQSSTIINRMDHPVVHVSRNDCLAYCQWNKTRLPTEAEWEVAAKGGTLYDKYPWGEQFFFDGHYECNIWQGKFPITNTEDDGFASTSPAKNYTPNDYGLYQMIGNVWEWCLNPRGIDLTEFQTKSTQKYYQDFNHVDARSYAIKGGSFLCHESYCKRYRIAARNGNTGDSASNNMGFRVVRDS